MLVEQFLNIVVSDVYVLGFFNDGLYWRKKLIVEMTIILQTLEELIDIIKIKLNQLVFEQVQYCQTYVKHETCAKGKYVVPYTNAQTQRKAVQEASHEPLVNPHLIWQSFVVEVLPEVWNPFFEEILKHLKVLNQEWELALIKAFQTIKRNLLMWFF